MRFKKLHNSALLLLFIMVSCVNNEKVLENTEIEETKSANLYNVSFEDDRIFYIDSIVYDIDKNDSLYVEEENKFFQNATINNITYVRSFNKKRGLLLKVKSTNRTPLDTTIVIAHYKNEQLIKTTAEVWGKSKGWKKMYVYYEKDNPILASPDMNSAAVERLRSLGKSLIRGKQAGKKPESRL